MGRDRACCTRASCAAPSRVECMHLLCVSACPSAQPEGAVLRGEHPCSDSHPLALIHGCAAIAKFPNKERKRSPACLLFQLRLICDAPVTRVCATWSCGASASHVLGQVYSKARSTEWPRSRFTLFQYKLR